MLAELCGLWAECVTYPRISDPAVEQRHVRFVSHVWCVLASQFCLFYLFFMVGWQQPFDNLCRYFLLSPSLEVCRCYGGAAFMGRQHERRRDKKWKSSSRWSMISWGNSWKLNAWELQICLNDMGGSASSTLTVDPDICLLTCHFRQPGLNDGNSRFAEFSSVKI